jgi:hypothetical protein
MSRCFHGRRRQLHRGRDGKECRGEDPSPGTETSNNPLPPSDGPGRESYSIREQEQIFATLLVLPN